MTSRTSSTPAPTTDTIDRLGVGVASLAAIGLAAGPFVTLKPNRILDGAPVGLFEALPPAMATLAAMVAAGVALIAALRTPPHLRLAAGAAALICLAVAAGRAPAHLVPTGDQFARVGPGWGLWLAALAFGLLAGDALVRLRFGPLRRVAALCIGFGVAAALIGAGALDELSIMKEYAARSQAFWAEGRTHLALSLGSVAAALAIGAPVGLACHLRPRVEKPAVGALTAIQTIPSIALFGLLMAPLGWLAAHAPGAAALGIAGVGAAPAFVALTLYALLPVVAGVASGLGAAPRETLQAGRGAGMTERQLLVGIKAPLGAPAVLAGLRVTLVQTIGLTTVAALIGGGGFGTFVFQGVGQTAIDLVLLGVIPTVALAVAASVMLDAAAEAAGGPPR